MSAGNPANQGVGLLICCSYVSGPVRHFMELVVTGLSNNPDYKVEEKQNIVKWYKEYFSQFTHKELQALPVEKFPQQDTIKTE